jgi:hypothetical protein
MRGDRLKRYLALAALLLTATTGAAQENMIVSGRILTLGGEPVSGAEVYLYAAVNTRKPADFISPKSSSAGTYRMVVPKAPYRAVARLKKGERYGPLMPGDRHSGEPVTIQPGEEQELTLDLVVADLQEMAQRRDKERAELAEVSGTIALTGRSGAPAYVYARTGRLAATLPAYFSAWAGPDGSYSLKLPPGRYYLGAATAFPPEEDGMQLTEVDIAAGNVAVAINLQLPLK